MTRRPVGFLVTLILAVLVTPVAAEAQPRGDVHRIGLLHYGSRPSGPGRGSEAFRRELRNLGWVEGQNLVIEDRFAEGQEARVSDLAHEFVAGQVEVVVVPNAGSAERVQRVTRTGGWEQWNREPV